MPSRERHGSGFTLIEMLAVVAIVAVVMFMLVPFVGVNRAGLLRGEARGLASHLELARQLAVMTGKPHRVLIDLEAGGYRVEWYVNDFEAAGEPPPERGELELGAFGPLDLAPPTGEERSFQPVRSKFGSFEWLDDRVYFEGVETPEGWLERGEVGVVFERDGSSDFAEIVIADVSDRAIVLEVRPYLELVRISDVEG